jgi:hypothetical protein
MELCAEGCWGGKQDPQKRHQRSEPAKNMHSLFSSS